MGTTGPPSDGRSDDSRSNALTDPRATGWDRGSMLSRDSACFEPTASFLRTSSRGLASSTPCGLELLSCSPGAACRCGQIGIHWNGGESFNCLSRAAWARGGAICCCPHGIPHGDAGRAILGSGGHPGDPLHGQLHRCRGTGDGGAEVKGRPTSACSRRSAITL